jgi:hypothetical protein
MNGSRDVPHRASGGRFPGGIRRAIACGAALIAIGCARQSPTAPPVTPSTPRAVGIALTDSLDVPLADATTVATSLFAVNGLAIVIYATTDPDGEAVLQMLPGAWIVSARAVDGRVAGTQALILDPTAHPDSVLVRLVAHTPSRIEGHARLAGRTDHRGILVTAIGIDAGAAVTDSTGAYAVDDVPPGTWTLFFGSLGFSDGFTVVTVPLPASTVIAPDIELISSPAPGPSPTAIEWAH